MINEPEKNVTTEQSEKESSVSSGKKHDVEREGWSAKELTAEASLDDADETKRQLVRGNETSPDENERDIVGSVDFNETPEGKDERKVSRKHAEKT
jgi:hypothetical protein